MNLHFHKWTTALVAAFISCHSIAEKAVEVPRHVLGASIGSVDTSSDYGFDTDIDALSYASTTGYSLSWGVENRHVRFALEYYHANADVQSPPFAVSGDTADLETQSLFYSGYWIPTVYRDLNAILGAGIGYSQHTLNNTQLEEFQEGDWSMKASAGVEYKIFKKFSVYALAEGIFHEDVEDQVAYSGDDDTSAGVVDRMLTGNEQARFAIGIHYHY